MSKEPEVKGKVPIVIDGDTVIAPKDSLTGAQLRQLTDPPIGNDRDLWLDLDGALDDLVEDGEIVTLEPRMVFFTVPKVINPGA